MKKEHESRIVMVSSLDVNRRSHILLYGANVGQHSSPVSYQKAAYAMLPNWYPADANPITLGMTNSSFRDDCCDFWTIEAAQLRNMISERVRPRLAGQSIEHLSVFAFAPQPLLMLLGFLLSDIHAVEVYQLHREPPDWRWQDHPPGFGYLVREPTEIKGVPALILALSATIDDDRITTVLDGEPTIWRVTIDHPDNDFLKSRQQLEQFRQTMRRLLDRIKARHGGSATIHVFPAVPVAIAVDMGRVVMSKADLPLRIYDENKSLGGFVRAVELNAALRMQETHHDGT